MSVTNRALRLTALSLLAMSVEASRAAIVTGGTRGIGRGIADALAADGFDLLLTYNTNVQAAEAAAESVRAEHKCRVELVGGDASLAETRDRIFACFDQTYKATHDLAAVVHNAGQYVGVTSDNADGLSAAPLAFGDGSLLGESGSLDLDQMRYYQRLYGEAYVDLMERGLARMGEAGGSLVGISSPGYLPPLSLTLPLTLPHTRTPSLTPRRCTTQYNPQPGYDMPGSGKCVMEYAMRLFALRCAGRAINCNVVVPGVTSTDAWGKLAEQRGSTKEAVIDAMAGRIAPMGSMSPRQLGDAVAFLCSPKGRLVTGVSLPVDGGVHLKT